MIKTFKDKNTGETAFELEVQGGEFRDSEIVVMLGENGTGKTTLIKMLAGGMKPDNDVEIPEMNVRLSLFVQLRVTYKVCENICIYVYWGGGGVAAERRICR